MPDKLLKHAVKLFREWEERKSWGNDYTGPHTTEEEDKLARCVQQFILREDAELLK